MKAYREMTKATEASILVSDTAEKDYFITIYGELKDPLGDDYKTIVANIKEDTSGELQVQRQLITVVNMAKDYVGSKLFTRILDMRWYNVKALVGLIRYINKEHGSDKVATIKRKVSNAGKDCNNMEYNNKLDELIKEIKKEYKVVLTDDSKVVTVNVKAMYAGLSLKQKNALLAMLMEDVEVEKPQVEEVA